ncbi:DNA polymerase III subunit alpha [Patescibacteria group bacterium]
MPGEFVHLHTHSHYSLLDGLGRIPDLIARAKELNQTALALTDHGVLYGAIEFYQKAKEAEINPLIGTELYVAQRSMNDRDAKRDANPFHLPVIATSFAGYQNLISLVTKAHLQGFYYKPRVDKELLKLFSKDLIALSGCLKGEIPRAIMAGKPEEARSIVREYQEIFGADNFYIELSAHTYISDQQDMNYKLIDLAQEMQVPVVVTTDIHYVREDDAEAHDVLLCVQMNRKVSDPDRMNMLDWKLYMSSADEIREAIKDWPEQIQKQAMENTVSLAERCNIEIPLGEILLPHYEVPENHTPSSYVRELCGQGYIKRYGTSIDQITPEQKERLDFEMEVIERMGFETYFLIVQDFVNHAKDKGIVVGPGRGSAAGSFVSYLLGITGVDPLQYGLLFERFLNPDRISMPDIDLDFADHRRDEVLEYVSEKYGRDHVAQIITFGTIKARAAIRDAGRALDYSYTHCDRIAKMIPMFKTLDETLEEVPEFKQVYDNEEGGKQLIDAARKLENVVRHTSIHACGVVISDAPLDKHVPRQYATQDDSIITTQYELHAIEDLGLLKMDFLGLANLTIIENTLDIIEAIHGKKIDIHNLPADDPLSFQLFQKAQTTGVFQLESSGMKRYLKELGPTEFEDIVAMVALYRPGPMELIPDYIAGKHGHKTPTYLHPSLEPILAKTYGVAIYQEQVMKMARELAGFTPGEADVLRKAMGKKIKELLDKQREKFIDGAVNNNVDRSIAERVWAFIEPFAGYGFNRSHAVGYAMIAYQTAYLKAHYPAEFMAALMTSDQGDNDRIAIEVAEARRMNIEVLPPDINESYRDFAVVSHKETEEHPATDINFHKPAIRFGLGAIKNVGDAVVADIIQARKKDGPFKSITDLVERIQAKSFNKKGLESLTKAGALDSFAPRHQILNNLEEILIYMRTTQEARNSGQVNLFASSGSAAPQLKLKEVQIANPYYTKQESLRWEKDLLGMYVSEHPLEEVAPLLAKYSTPIKNITRQSVDNYLRVAGIVTAVRKIITKNGKTMLFVTLEDMSDQMEIIVFPNLYEQGAEPWAEDSQIFVEGRVNDRDANLKIIGEKVFPFTKTSLEKTPPGQIVPTKKQYRPPREQNPPPANFQTTPVAAPPPAPEPQVSRDPSLEIDLADANSPEKLKELKQKLVVSAEGKYRVFLLVPNGTRTPQRIETEFKIDSTPALISEIEQIVGSGRVR